MFWNQAKFCAIFKNCGRYLGCFSCLSNLQDCPQCRKPLYKLNCPTCDSDIQQEIVPLFILDLPTIPGLDDIPRPDIIRVPSNPWWCFLYMLYIDTLQKVPIVIIWYFFLWDRTFVIIILRYHIMNNFVFKFYVADLIGTSNQSYIVSRRVSN